MLHLPKSRKSIAWLTHRQDKFSLHIKHFFHHREALARIKIGDGLEKADHLLLPAQIGGILVENLPRALEVSHIHYQKQVQPAAEDGIMGDSHFFELGQKL